jgi:hypothetical protein
MSMGHKWNDNGRVKTKYLAKNLSQCHFVHNKSNMDWLGIEPGPTLSSQQITAWAHYYILGL